ncbi:MAG: hypothetical protein V1834_00820, partial [Candidatus Micrarchaeota archaeon]
VPPNQFTASFTPTAEFRVENGEVKASVAEIVFQIDSVLPGDAVPIDLSSIQGCALTHEFTGETRNCFTLDKVKGRIYFKSNDFGTNCPIKVNGNTLPAQITGELVIGCAPNKNLVLPIKVKTTNYESFVVDPRRLSPGDDSVKIIYLTSEKQVGARVIELTGFNDLVGLSEAETKAIAWHDDSLTMVEDGTQLAQRLYNRIIGYNGEAIDSAPLNNAAGLGDAVISCSTKWCCANGWCNPSAFRGAFNALKKDAKEMAKATLFRRGNGEPAASLGLTEFKMVVPMQVGEGAKEILSANDLTVRIPSGCSNENPAVVAVTASSEDGEKWDYAAEVMQLSLNLNNAGNKPDLCNFLWGNGNEIKSDDEANLVTAPQTTDEHRSPKIGIASFVAVYPLKYACEADEGDPWTIAKNLVFIPVPELELTGDGAKVQLMEFTTFRCTSFGPCCTPKEAWMQIGQRDNQMYYILHLGIASDCTPLLFPSLKGFLKDTAMNWAAGELGEAYSQMLQYQRAYGAFQEVVAAFDEDATQELISPNGETMLTAPGCGLGVDAEGNELTGEIEGTLGDFPIHQPGDPLNA